MKYLYTGSDSSHLWQSCTNWLYLVLNLNWTVPVQLLCFTSFVTLVRSFNIHCTKKVLSSPFGVSMKWCGYESIYFLTNLLQSKAFFLYWFGKIITLINNDRKAKLDSERTVNSKQFLNQFLKQHLTTGKAWLGLD